MLDEEGGLAAFKIFLCSQKWLTYDQHPILRRRPLRSAWKQMVCLCEDWKRALGSLRNGLGALDLVSWSPGMLATALADQKTFQSQSER